MVLSGDWQELQLSAGRECPKLFYSYSITDDGFTLLLTDLMGLWRSSLDKYDIVAEARRQHCPIDPSESPKQFNVLLSKIEQSLLDCKNILARETINKCQFLVLRTSLDLPKPLRPLQWTFKLIPQSSSEMAEQILRPSLHEVSVSQQKLDSLYHIIKDKDHVISRLLDKDGNSAVDLSLVFPGITGIAPRRGHITVPEAMKHIPGLAPFDQSVWTKQFGTDDDYDCVDRAGLRKLVGGCEKCFIHTRAEHENWIDSLSSPSTWELESGAVKQKAFPDKDQPVDADDVSTEGDDDFERQATSPSVRKPKAITNLQEDQVEATPAKRARPSKLGGLGRRNASTTKSPSPDLSRDSSPQTPRHELDASELTETESDDETSQHATRFSTKPAAKLSRLGKLGARSKPSTFPAPAPSSPFPSPASPPSRPASSSASTPSHRPGEAGTGSQRTTVRSPEPQPGQLSTAAGTPSRRLGRLGARKQVQAQVLAPVEEDSDPAPTSARTRITPSNPQAEGGKDEKAEDSDATASTSSSLSPRRPEHSQSQSRIATAESSSPNSRHLSFSPETHTEPEPETLEQKANRRREELKRTINASTGTRKKRRF